MSEVSIVKFNTNAIRIVMKDDDPWFVAADVCAALGIKNPSDAIKILDEDERARFNLGRSAINGGGAKLTSLTNPACMR